MIMVEMICIQCEKLFSVVPSKYNIRKYCSRKCFSEALSKKILKSCLFCEESFLFSPRLIKRKYCSTKCSGKALSQKLKKLNCLKENEEDLG